MDLPKGWVVANWSDVAIITHGQSQKEVASPDGIYPIYGSGGEIGRATKSLCKAGSTVVGRKGTINRPFFANNDFWNIDTAFGVTPYKDIHPKFFFAFCQHFNFKTLDHSSGRPSLTQSNLYGIKMPIPPFAEQQRIVEKLDELFSRLDKGVETLLIIKCQLKTYRQAVLKWAFEEDEWELVPLSSITSYVTSGSRGWAKYYSTEGAKFIRIGNLTRHGINLILDDVQCVLLPDKAEGLRSLLKQNDMLISITADLGSIGIVPCGLGEAYINQHIALTRFKSPSAVRFYAWYLKSDKGRKELLKNQRGGTKIGLGLDDVRDALVPSLSEEEACTIVTAIESRLSVCDKLEAIADDSLTKAKALRQSILKKAFTGQLVPQDPNDEPADKLLERIQRNKV